MQLPECNMTKGFVRLTLVPPARHQHTAHSIGKGYFTSLCCRPFRQLSVRPSTLPNTCRPSWLIKLLKLMQKKVNVWALAFMRQYLTHAHTWVAAAAAAAAAAAFARNYVNLLYLYFVNSCHKRKHPHKMLKMWGVRKCVCEWVSDCVLPRQKSGSCQSWRLQNRNKSSFLRNSYSM